MIHLIKSRINYDFIIISFARLLVIIFQLLYVKLFTNNLSETELGVYYFLVSTSYFFNAFLFVPIDLYQQSILYDLVKNNESLRTYIKVNKKIIIPYFMFAIGAVFVCSFINKTYSIYLILCVLMAVFLYKASFTKNILNNLEHKRIVCMLQIIEAVLKLLFLLIIFAALKKTAITLILSNCIALFISVLITFFAFYKLNIWKNNNKIEKTVSMQQVFSFCYPLSISAGLNWIQLQGFRLAFVPLGYAETIGVFSAVVGVGMAAMSAVSLIYSQCFLPKVYKTNGNFIFRYLQGGLFIVAFVTIVSWCSSDWIIPLLTKTQFIGYSKLIVYGVLIEAGNFIIGGLSVKLAIDGKTRTVLTGAVASVLFVITTLAIAYKTRQISYHVFGIVLVTSQIVMAAYIYYQMVHKGRE